MKVKIFSILYSVFIVLFVIIFPVISGIIVSIKQIKAPITYYVQAFFILIPLLVLIFLIKIGKISRSDLYLQETKNKKKHFYLFLAFLILIPPLYKGVQLKDLYSIIGIFLLYFMVGICEELYFRGVITTILSRNFSRSVVIIVSTIIFGLGHLASAFTGISIGMTALNVVNALLFGLMSISLLILLDSIYPLILLHFMFDFETKFVLLDNNELLIAEIIRGGLMGIICIYFVYNILKNKRSLAKTLNKNEIVQ